MKLSFASYDMSAFRIVTVLTAVCMHESVCETKSWHRDASTHKTTLVDVLFAFVTHIHFAIHGILSTFVWAIVTTFYIYINEHKSQRFHEFHGKIDKYVIRSLFWLFIRSDNKNAR